MMILSMPNRFSLNQRHEGTVNVGEIEVSSYQRKRAFQKGVKMVEEAQMLFDRLFFSPFPLSNRDDILIKHCVLGPSPMRFFSTSHPLAFGSAIRQLEAGPAVAFTISSPIPKTRTIQ